MDKTVTNSKGFTLVELLVALVIVGVILVTVLTFLSNTMMLRRDSKNSEVAHLLGQDKIIELRAMANPTAALDTIVLDNQKYIRSWIITPISGSSLLATATVTVQYRVNSKNISIKCSGGIN